jgi:hypothetical protein
MPRLVLACYCMNKSRRQLIKRTLALDLHPRSFGYAVFENADLLDWGLRKWPSRRVKTVGRKVTQLFNMWQPMRLLIREGAPPREREMAQAVARNAKVPVVDIRRAVVQDAFQPSRRVSRFEIAELISERYPELHPRLPTKRKLTENEPFQVRMFNAVAIGMAFGRMPYHKAHE